MRRLYVFFGFIFFYSVLFGQDSPALDKNERIDLAISNILNLENGVLVFQLKTDHKKITELERLINSQDVSEQSKYRLKKERDKAVDIRERFNNDLISEIKANYRFSDYAIIYDTDAKLLKESPQKVKIIASSNSGFDFKNAFYLIVKEAWAKSSGLEALILHDRDLNALGQPFPYYYGINSIDRLFLSIFSSKTYYKKSAEKIVKKMNDSLTKFRERVYFKEKKN